MITLGDSHGVNRSNGRMSCMNLSRFFFTGAPVMTGCALFATALTGTTYTNFEVTAATLDEGGAENIITANRTVYDFILGSTTSGNSLSVSNGAVFKTYGLHIGTGSYETVGDASAGSHNSLTVTGEGTRLQLATTSDVAWVDITVGRMGSWNTATLSGGVDASGDITVGEGLIAYISAEKKIYFFPELGCHNSLLITGEGTTFSGDLRVGVDGSHNSARIEDGAVVDSYYSLNIGIPFQLTYTTVDTTSATDIAPAPMGCDNRVTVTGAGSAVILDGRVNLGASTQYCTSSDNVLTVDDCALVACAEVDADTTGSGNCLHLGNGYLALKGDRTADLATVALYLRLPSGAAWTQATDGDLRALYFDSGAAGNSEAKTATANNDFDGYDNLGGYTVIATGAMLHPDVSWSEGRFFFDGWCASPFFGTFFAARSFSGWIWHEYHAWQYIHPASTKEAAYLWDPALGWNFTGRDFYPFLYSFRKECWLYYVDGLAPSRRFWDYSDASLVFESSLSD